MNGGLIVTLGDRQRFGSNAGHQPGSKQDFAIAHTTSGHRLQHQSILSVGGPENDFVKGFFGGDTQLDHLWPFEDLFDNSNARSSALFSLADRMNMELVKFAA